MELLDARQHCLTVIDEPKSSETVDGRPWVAKERVGGTFGGAPEVDDTLQSLVQCDQRLVLSIQF